jgi:ATP:ADP antiporter, AAA family
MGTLFKLRAAERASTAAAFGFLTLLVASHAVLETARDALFLARLPATRLPAVYLAIAAFSLVLARLEARFLLALSQRVALVLWTAVSSVGTFFLYVILPARARAGDMAAELGLCALYVWSGMIAGLVLVHFWSLLGATLSVTQARRLYPLIGTGSVVGAMLGSGLASVIARVAPADNLLLIAAAGFGVSTLIAGWLAHETPALPAQTAASGGLAPAADPALELSGMPSGLRRASDTKVMEDARLVARQPYMRRFALLILTAGACLTLVDFMFKSVVAAQVPAAELATFFGGASFALNLLSLFCQLTVSAWLLKRLDPGVMLAVLPGLLTLGAFGIVAGLGFAAVLASKAADGALRYSLHRTASELIYLPLPDRVRPRIKAVLDTVGQRAGQALASLLILALSALGATLPGFGIALLVLACVWAAIAVDLRRHYIDLLRSNVRVGASPQASAFPELDVASLETLVAALDSHTDAEVLAALAVLEREGKTHLVPALILHHPSELVVERALELFARVRRKHVVSVIDRLLDHPSARLRSAALAARSLIAPDPKLLYERLSLEDSPQVRATIVVHLIALGEIVGQEAEQRLSAILTSDDASAKAALSDAIAWRADESFDHVLVQLSAARELDVQLAAIAAMARRTSPAFLPSLIGALADERTRSAARAALRHYGEAGLRAVQAALQDPDNSRALRWELPRALALFEPERAVKALLAQLIRERDGMVRYRIIRALEAVVAKHPTVALDEAALEGVIRATITRAYRSLDERLILERGAEARPERRTPGHELLMHVLIGKEVNARDRLFRLLGLMYPTSDFARIRRGLRSPSAKVRASCVELVSTLLNGPVRGALVGLTEDMPDADRLASAGPFYEPSHRNYEDQLQHMLSSESAAVQDVTAYHVAELGLTRMRPLIEAIAEADPGRADLVTTLARLPAVVGILC